MTLHLGVQNKRDRSQHGVYSPSEVPSALLRNRHPTYARFQLCFRSPRGNAKRQMSPNGVFVLDAYDKGNVKSALGHGAGKYWTRERTGYYKFMDEAK